MYKQRIINHSIIVILKNLIDKNDNYTERCVKVSLLIYSSSCKEHYIAPGKRISKIII